jgi:hypothetical protein
MGSASFEAAESAGSSLPGPAARRRQQREARAAQPHLRQVAQGHGGGRVVLRIHALAALLKGGAPHARPHLQAADGQPHLLPAAAKRGSQARAGVRG